MPDIHPNTQRIKRITERIIGLPTLPTVVSKMIQLVDNPKTSAASLARLISTDQSLTARLLKLANSAYYGFSREISTVNMAIVVMGFNAVKDMGLSLSVFDIFGGIPGTKIFDVAGFWEHSVGCGVASKIMADKYYQSKAGEAFVAGLLHDIGKIVLAQYLQKEFLEIMHKVVDDNEQYDDAEMEVVGVNHGEIGGWLAEKWRLPHIISESIRYHHMPWESKKEPVMVALVGIADYLCHIAGIGSSGRREPVYPSRETWEILEMNGISLDENDLDNLQTEVLIEFDKTNSFLSFIHSDAQDENV